MKPIRYTIVPKQPAAHLFEVTVTVADPDPAGQRFMLPVWIPGSYMVREFARNIVTLRAVNEAGRKVRVEKTDKHTWQAAPVKGALTLRYEVYAWDLSVRAAHLDDTTGFFNGTSVFLAPLGHEEAQCLVDIQKPEGAAYRNWRVATALPEARGTKRYGFGEYRAQNYDELIDHPVTLGEFALATFKAHGVPHDIVVAGRVIGLDMARLSADLKRICEAQIALFEPKSKKAPVDRYVFMTQAVTDGYGGLEHRASTARLLRTGRQTTDKLKATLQTRLADVTIKSVTKSPIAGLYEVNLGTQIIYSDANGDYLMLGDMVDAKTRKNLTEARLSETNRIDFASLPFANAVKVVKGNGARKIAVFSDPNCPYCKQLETTLKSIDNVTVYTFLYPVLSPDSTAKSKSIWCSTDRAKAWESWMQDHQAPTAAGTCDTAAIDKNLALGRAMNVDGTPTVFLADGRRLPGAVPADRLDKEMSAVH